MIPHTGFLAGLEVREGEVFVALGEYTAGELAVVGLGRAEIDGPYDPMRRPGQVTTAIVRAIDEAELVSGVEITSVRLAMNGASLGSVAVRGGTAVLGRDRVVTVRDERSAVAAAVASHPLPAGRAILQVVVQDFIVDGQDGIGLPTGFTALAPLEANVLLVTCYGAVKDALISCVRLAGRDVLDTVAAPLAAGAVLLGLDERELGAALLDIHRDWIGIAVFERGGPRHLSTLRLSDGPESDDVGQRVRAAIDGSGFAECLRTDVVLTGSAKAPGLRERIEQALDLAVVIGEPHLGGPHAGSVDGFPYAAAFGLLVLGNGEDHQRPEPVPTRLVDQRNWRG